MVFSSPARPWHQVLVAGRWAWGPAQAAAADAIAHRFRQVMCELWPDPA